MSETDGIGRADEAVSLGGNLPVVDTGSFSIEPFCTAPFCLEWL